MLAVRTQIHYQWPSVNRCNRCNRSVVSGPYIFLIVSIRLAVGHGDCRLDSIGVGIVVVMVVADESRMYSMSVVRVVW